MPLNFIEAARAVRNTEFSRAETVGLLASGTTVQMEMFVRGEAARHGVDLTLDQPEFGTLQQVLHGSAATAGREIALLCPWDFVPALDWRGGGSADIIDVDAAMRQAEAVAEAVARRAIAGLAYLDAPVLPVFGTPERGAAMRLRLRALAAGLGATAFDAGDFDLQGYLTTGSALASAALGRVAQALIAPLVAPAREARKILVTDLDETLWHGVLGEDGLEGITAEPDGAGFPHFIYQRHLGRLRGSGVLVSVVSKNDMDLVEAALASGKCPLGVDDFVAVSASYEPKHSQVAALARKLNLGLEAFVFVDDNPVEIAQMEAALPAVTCIRFPNDAGDLVGFMATLTELFPIRRVTSEDRRRSDLYRKMAETAVDAAASEADIGAFLKSLGMTLTIHDRGTGDRTRAVQLINKTNQFNMNGVRRDETEVARVLEAGGSLFTAELSDRSGSHGEVISFLADQSGRVLSFVMSCRVFQRTVEHAFLARMAERLGTPLTLDYRRTERNTPFRMFLETLFGGADEGPVVLPDSALDTMRGKSAGFFTITDGAAR